MRAMLRVMNTSRSLKFYAQVSSYAVVHGIKMPSFEEFFNLPSEEVASSFNTDTDKFLEQKARELLEQRTKETRVG